MEYPTLEQINQANRFQICKWYRFLDSPKNQNEIKIIDRIVERFRELGGYTPEISKALGWGGRYVR